MTTSDLLNSLGLWTLARGRREAIANEIDALSIPHERIRELYDYVHAQYRDPSLAMRVLGAVMRDPTKLPDALEDMSAHKRNKPRRWAPGEADRASTRAEPDPELVAYALVEVEGRTLPDAADIMGCSIQDLQRLLDEGRRIRLA